MMKHSLLIKYVLPFTLWYALMIVVTIAVDYLLHRFQMVHVGLYLGYIPFNSVFFDRMLATFKYVGTVGFLIYLADSFGYLGSIAVVFYKNFGQPNLSWLEFFLSGGYIISVVGTLLIFGSMIYFHVKHTSWQR